MQETTDTRDLPESLRQRIIEYFKYKYRDGKVRNQEEVLRELPYDMQVGCCPYGTLFSISDTHTFYLHRYACWLFALVYCHSDTHHGHKHFLAYNFVWGLAFYQRRSKLLHLAACCHA